MTDWRIDVNKNSMGGTEILVDRLFAEFGDSLEPFQIIPSRVRELKPDKIRVLWLHDCAEDPENEHLKNDGWKKFHKIVFVSHTQKTEYQMLYNIPPSMITVLQNSIVPIDVDIENKSNDKINIIYTPTPHRGLGLLVPVFQKLAETHKNVHLDVFSSFALYGWAERDKPFQELFQAIKDHPQMTYHGTVPNDQIREALKKSHIFAYPSIWRETGCLSLMEAMSAGLACVHSSLGALPETAANWTFMYDFEEDMQKHASRFYQVLDHAIRVMGSDRVPVIELKSQKSYADLFYNWNLRKLQWKDLLDTLAAQYKDQALDIPKTEAKFVYGA